MDLNKNTIFVAGGTGMVGAHIISCLLKSFPRLKIHASRFQTKPFLKDRRLKYVKGDLRKVSDCRRLVRDCDYVVMAAAQTANAYTSRSNALSLVTNNLLLNMNLLGACAAGKVKRVVFIGSSVLYQDASRSLKEEQLDLNADPHPAYFGLGWTMRFLEKASLQWHRETGIPMVMVRAANIYGPFARFDPLTSNFIPALIRKAVAREDPFEVWGSPDVGRDIIYAGDFARVIVRLLQKDGLRYDIFNVGSGKKTTVREAVRIILKSAGHNPQKLVYNKKKPTTMKVRILDCAKIKKTSGWKERVSLEEGIRMTLEWWKENKGRWKK